ncbi:CBF/NF-Y transcription factor family protein [Entamoeba histolytica HM-1:IMSS-B]|uniref:Dr1-associated corepressor, putative n=6 Tax=Entamoeba histolytica TaxID=5759 RepID=C4LZ35_ENTH1|nr:Dr1-associated corepressor, putative [Entamoeba histolytica HM-1:IMSS]EMD42801.1 Dr1-associated corepressor, putative [Entamoeba histolytica KU27]EMH74759.1 CBF/NF-Y transcription factor family protein [Entamoeba histolytica HM-1:IMSS-B]EMS12775.1 Dr1-associated corepressor, putative [Entamoeba histolytica HM-3:IMSS]ENY62273.1 Dr1-associated corepressor, putative [Entamoeba histolytica HM-1:IMSS-A]GAT94108.1 cbf nf-y transcription factor family protein [Entamoeba histolytica]|eukprot:XP_654674.1 Dr1-associated corepressor, putative [Entamoeba histolytica HM-1:IMSS]
MKRNTATLLPAARVKRIMQEDEDVGKMSGNVPMVIARATELFLVDLIKKTNTVAEEKKSKSVNLSHLHECVKNTPVFDFLIELIEAKMAENPPEERKRSKKDSGDEGITSSKKRKLEED